MLKPVFVSCLLIALALIFAACAAAGLPSAVPSSAPPAANETDGPETAAPTQSDAPTATPSGDQAGVSGPAVMPARPGSGATSDPSANLHDLVEASGVVKEAKGQLVLITAEGGGEFMLRFSDNTRWDEGVDQTIAVGNRITCQVKPEPTFTTPAQGEVFFVTENAKAE